MTPGEKLKKIRQIAKVTKFGKKIFTAGAGKYYDTAAGELSLAKGFESILELAGVKVPKGAKVTLDVAQIVISGGAFVDKLETGSTIMQSANLASGALGGIASLLSDCGLVDPQVADFANLGAAALLVISSAGANVFADIACVIDVIKCALDLKRDFFGSKDEAIAQAKTNLSSAVHAIVDPQIAYASEQADLFAKGQINVFDMIGNIALNSPITFKGFYPTLACYFPSWIDTTVTSQGESSGWFKTQRDTEKFTLPTQVVTDKIQIQDILIEKFVAIPMQDYFLDRIPERTISLKALSVLSMLVTTATGKSCTIDQDTDIIAMMQIVGVTPYVLGDYWVFEGGLSRTTVFKEGVFDLENDLPYLPLTFPAPEFPSPDDGLIINGNRLHNAVDDKIKKHFDDVKNFQKELYRLDRDSDIEALMQNKESAAMLKAWAQIRVVPTWDDTSKEPLGFKLKQGATPISAQSWFNYGIVKNVPASSHIAVQDPFAPLRRMAEILPGASGPMGKLLDMAKHSFDTHVGQLGPAAETTKLQVLKTVSPQYTDYVLQNYTIELSDYWKCLNMVYKMRQAGIMSDRAAQLSQFGSYKEIQEQFETTYMTVIMKQLNLKARQNIADMFGVPVDKLGRRVDAGGAVVYYKK